MALTEKQEEQAKKNRKYWKDREDEALANYQKSEKEYDKEIQRIYSDMLDACNKEINAFYGKYADKEGITLAEAKKRARELDIKEYERKAARYVKDKDFSTQANEEMRIYNLTMKVNRLEMLKANIGLETIKGHDELEKFMSGILKGRTEEELARQAGILGKTIRNNAQLAHTIPNASFHNATFSDRIWQYQDLMREDLSKILSRALIQGKNPRAVAKELQKYWYGNDPRTGGGAVYCMERLMRTELARVQTEAQKQSFIRNGFEEYEFIANSGCCDICKNLDGKHFKVSKMMPGENASPMHPHCRCSTAAYSDRKEYDEWLDFLSKGGTTAEFEKMKAKNGNTLTAILASSVTSGSLKKAAKQTEKQPQAQEETQLTNIPKNDILKPQIQLFAEKDIKNQESNSLKRAIRKYEKLINEHQMKINNPELFIEGWEDKDVREQNGLIKHWKKEVRNFQTSIDDRVSELKDRGDYDE